MWISLKRNDAYKFVAFLIGIILFIPIAYSEISDVTTSNNMQVNWIYDYQSPVQQEFTIYVNQSFNPIDIIKIPSIILDETTLNKYTYKLYEVVYTPIIIYKTCEILQSINDCSINETCKKIDIPITIQDSTCGVKEIQTKKDLIPVSSMILGKEKKEYKIILTNPIITNKNGYGGSGTLKLTIDNSTFYDKTHSSWFNVTWIDKYNITTNAMYHHTLTTVNISNTTCYALKNSTRVIYNNITNIVWDWSSDSTIKFVSNETANNGNYTLYCNATGVTMGNNTIDLTGTYLNGLAFYWTFDSITLLNGENFTDVVANNYAKKPTAFTNLEGKFGESLNTSDTNYGATVKDNINFAGKNFSIVAWQRVTGLGSAGSIVFSNRQGSTTRQYLYYGWEGTNIIHTWYADDLVIPYTVPLYTWMLISATFNMLSDNKTISINGTYLNVSKSGGDFVGNGNASNIGGVQSNTGYAGKQKIDDLAIYYRELKDTDLREIWTYGNLGFSLYNLTYSFGIIEKENYTQTPLKTIPTSPLIFTPVFNYYKNIMYISYNTSQTDSKIVNYTIFIYGNSTEFNETIKINNNNTLNYSFDSSTINDGDYYLRVNASNSISESNISDSLIFYIDNTVPIIFIESPKNNTMIVNLNPLFYYNYTEKNPTLECIFTNTTGLNNTIKANLSLLA
jgi:hypothetical protein